MIEPFGMKRFAFEPEVIVDRLVGGRRRVLLFGQPGVGKSTLAGRLAACLHEAGRRACCLAADPGSPVFGVPGAVSLGVWTGPGWSLSRIEALCSLDAARFRLPLVSAVGALAAEVSEAVLLVDAPGVTRGVAGAELLTALAQAAGIDLVLVLSRHDDPPLAVELQALGVETAFIAASQEARRPGKATRARQRTMLWDRYLEGAQDRTLAFHRLRMIGTPPRRAPEAWVGKQVGLVDDRGTLAMGEVTGMDSEGLTLRLPGDCPYADTLVVRDAGRGADGLLATTKPFGEGFVRYLPATDLVPDVAGRGTSGARPVVHLGTAMASLINGVFGDPLLHLRLRHQRRSLLFDLGEGSRLPARIAHQVSDVFLTHAHVDHISGFFWLLRSRIGEAGVCRLYGPPGLAAHVEGLVSGIHWDRIGNRGPRFDILELHGKRLRRYRLQAGRPGCDFIGEEVVQDGVLLAEEAFRVRAVTLDHGTPVLAFAYEPARQINVRKERLREMGWDAGSWLNELKERIHAGEESARITLPDGREETVAMLAPQLVLITPGSRLVYASDFGDTPDNRRSLVELARGAHTLFCEATFLERESAQAARTGHLTTRGCGEIANEAGVEHLIPFHFSRRYEEEPSQVYMEIAAVSPRVVMPSQRVADRE